MFIELIDLLRCPVDHEESWLVAAFGKMDGRFVIEGKLGCPVCSASYPIAGGVAEFSPRAAAADIADADASSLDEVTRIAALLGLTRPGMTVVLSGAFALIAPAVVIMTEARVVAMNAMSIIQEAENVASITAGNRLPFASRSIDGIVLGDADQMADAARVLRPGGRIVAPVSVSASGSFRELARDERNVVLESVGELVRLRRDT